MFLARALNNITNLDVFSSTRDLGCRCIEKYYATFPSSTQGAQLRVMRDISGPARKNRVNGPPPLWVNCDVIAIAWLSPNIIGFFSGVAFILK